MNITLFFEYLKKENLEKDPFFVPYYLGKKMGYDVTILYSRFEDNKDMPPEYKGVKLIPFKVYGSWQTPHWIRYVNIYNYIRKNAKKINVFMRFFEGRKSEIAVMLYKLFNPCGKVYVKLDIDPFSIPTDKIAIKGNFLKRYLECKWQKTYIKRLDVVSCETTEAYIRMKKNGIARYQFGDKLVVVPNGIDEEGLERMGIGLSPYSFKENIFITVGRLGTEQKNTEMLLQALEHVNFKNWQFYLIGNIASEFQKKIDDFFERCPDKINNVRFVGPIYSRQQLYAYYNKSKSFVLTSRFESFAIVFAEAKRFSNYIVSTPVGAAYDIVENDKYGKIISHQAVWQLVETLQDIVDGRIDTNVYGGFDYKTLSWEAQLKVVIERLIK